MQRRNTRKKTLAVAAVVQRMDGRFLLIQRAPERPAAGYWTPVTGRPKPGESLEEAARREVLEEVGLRVRIGREIHRCPTEGAPWTLIWFAASPLDETQTDALCLQREEVQSARWVTAHEALSLDLEPMFPATREFFAKL